MSSTLDYTTELQVVSRGYDRQTEWFQPRIGVIPPQTAVLTVSKSYLRDGSDIFGAVHVMQSGDRGRTWSTPEPQPSLDRRALANGLLECPCDLTPAWHQKTGKLLTTGHSSVYAPGGVAGSLLLNNENRRHGVWSVYDSDAKRFSEWQKLVMPDSERFFWFGAGCTQSVERADGDLMLPLYAMDRITLGSNMWKGCFFSTVARCSFDGTMLRYIEHGNEMTVPDCRGLYEPSLTLFGGRYFLTLRNDVRACVTSGADGLQFDPIRPWTFDDGQELGSFNTQQHWVTHSEGLFLVYTRRNANNDHVFRCRAPLFMAEVDPRRLVVLRHTERELVPNYGAQLGNFGAVNVDEGETWVATSEAMKGDAMEPANLELTERRGADARVWLCRVQWNRPNRLAPSAAAMGCRDGRSPAMKVM